MDNSAITPLSPQAAVRQLTDASSAFTRAEREAMPVETVDALKAVEEGAETGSPRDNTQSLEVVLERLAEVSEAVGRPLTFAPKAAPEGEGEVIEVREAGTETVLREISQEELEDLDQRLNRYQQVVGLFVDEKA
jgi:uncharacterized FlaG/YvyC family protein